MTDWTLTWFSHFCSMEEVYATVVKSFSASATFNSKYLFNSIDDIDFY